MKVNKKRLGGFLFYLVVGIIIITLVVMSSSCSTTQTAVATQSTETKTEIPKAKPIIWKQDYYRALSLKDSILFYNSSEIRLEGSFFNQTFFVENGVLNVIDSTHSVSRIVQAETPGGLVDMKKDKNGVINIMYVAFSKEEATYRFSFFRATDGTFILNGKAELEFNGKKYPVTASTVGNCVLMFYLNRQNVREEDKGVAPGWQLENNSY